MALTAIINLVLAATIIICAWQGFKKGIIMGIIEVLVIILSLYGAQLLSDTFSYEIIPVLNPFVSGFMDSRVDDTAYAALGYEPDMEGEYHVEYSLTDLLDGQSDVTKDICLQVYTELGIYHDVAEAMADKAATYAEQNSSSISSAAVNILCQSITWYGGFFLFFLLVFAALTVLVNIPNLSFRIPYVGIVNDIGGLGIGLFTGFLLCAVLVWALQFTGLVIPEESLQGHGLAGFFLSRDMLANYINF